MTDKPSESLNLIERMAKRMAAEAGQGVSVQPVSPSFAERVVQKVAPTAPVAAPASQISKSGNGIAHPVREAAATVPAARPVALDAKPTNDVSSKTALKQVRLDFRVLRQNGMITPDNPSSALANEFRGIKRKLLQKVRDPKTRATVNNLVMVSSSLPEEGKTFSSMNLAISLAAERGLNVVLIDADIIRPSVGDMFVAPPSEGLTDLLTGKAGHVSEVLYTCADVPNLSVVFAGKHNPHSPELISSTRMANLCKEISVGYSDRVIVIDTPPVLASPEPAILASYVHQIIMVVSAGVTDRHQLRKSLEAVSSCQNVTLLFNKAPRWNDPEYSYYGYGYGPQASQTDATAS